MSWLSSAGHKLGSALNSPWVKGIGTAALGLTGVGLPAAIGIGGGLGALGGALRPGGGLKGALTQGGQGALLGAGGSLAGTAGRAALGAVGGGAKGAAGTVAGKAGGLIPHDADGSVNWLGGGGLLGQAAGGIKDTLMGNGGLNALGIAQGLNAANLGKQSTDYANKAFDLQNNSYQERAPLRALGLQGLTQPKAPNMAGIAATTGANPFAKRPLGVR
jgi:hypothetical protein